MTLFKTAFLLTICLLLALTGAFAQTAAPTPDPGPPVISAPVPVTDASADPQYFLAAGTGFNHYASKQASGFMTFGIRVGDGSYTYTTLTMTSVSSSLSQGFMKVLIKQDGFTLAALGDAGVASGGGNVGSAFAGGGTLAYDIAKWTKVPKTAVVATVKILKTSLNDVQPVFCFGISKSF